MSSDEDSLRSMVSGRLGEPDEDDASLEPTDNPLAGGLSISVSVPESVEIKMVDASTLHDYEIWAFIVSLLASALVGFVVAAMQAWEANSAAAPAWAWMSVVIALLLAASGLTLVRQRKKLSRRSKSVTLRVVSAEQRVRRKRG